MKNGGKNLVESSDSLASEGQADCQSRDEKELVRKSQSGDTTALAEIYERYFDRIYRYTVLKIGSPQEAEDITQEVFIKALREIKSYSWKGPPFASWLYRIAHNQIIDHIRKRERRPCVMLEETLAYSVFPMENPQTAAEISWDMRQLVTAISALTPMQREVIAMRFASDMPLAEVAAAVGKSVGAVKALQHSAIEMMRKRMGDG
jgi:RNA polymerase sigma-70 factor (ECF subfamily)